ncbi:extensin family protein [Xanthobacter autotrophicus DSM 431]|uniref:extensin family protein n=1 Tax=Xanthobacter nonsaccharivorans TaxID=3119912 RepID=UPI00372C3A59
MLLLLGAPGVAAAAAPLPPQRPAALAAAPVSPSARRPALRTAPLPPPRPAEIEALRASEEEAEQEVAPAAAPPEPQFAARSAPATPFFNPFAPATAPEPEEVAPPAPSGTEGSAGVVAPGALPPACAALVADGAMIAVAEKPISTVGSCGVAHPVRLSAVRIGEGRMAAMKPEAVITCEVAAAVADWVREDLAPAVRALGSEIETVRVAASYDCRGRNRIAGARMSEHGLGKALDVGGFELADRRVILVEKGGLPRDLRGRMKDSACLRFATVLGPGSDGYHEDHIHVDLAERKRDFKLCRWNLDAPTLIAGKKSGAREGADRASPAEGAPVSVASEGKAGGGEKPADGKPVHAKPAAGSAGAKSGATATSNGKPPGTGAKPSPKPSPKSPSKPPPASPSRPDRKSPPPAGDAADE